MKKILALVLVLLLSLGLFACSKKEESFDVESAKDTLLASDEFKDAKLSENDDVEFEYDITLEDCESFYMYVVQNAENDDPKGYNCFILAKAKEGSEKLMYAELEKLEKAYCDYISGNMYTSISQYTSKVEEKYQSSENGIYILIISQDSSASAELIGK